MKSEDSNIEYRNPKQSQMTEIQNKKQFYHLNICISNLFRVSCFGFRYSSRAGFTIIELLVVFSLMAVMSVIGFAAFSSFSSTQKLTTTVLDLKNTLNQAKSQAINQVDTCQSGQKFSGYQVLICCSSSASCKPCSSLGSPTPDGYELDIVCGGTASPISGKKLPTGLSINTNTTNTYTIWFNALTNTVTGPGQVTITQGSTNKNISISSTGVIQ